MGVFDDNPFIKLGPRRVAAPPRSVVKDAYASGGWWPLARRGEGFELEYLSGRLDGRARMLAVAPAEAERIRQEGDAAVRRLLLHTPGAG